MTNDGPQPVSRVEQLKTELAGEVRKWDELGVPLSAYQHPSLELLCRIKVLEKLVLDRFEIEEDDAHVMFLEMSLATFKEMREEVEPQIAEQREAHRAAQAEARLREGISPRGHLGGGSVIMP